MAVVTFCGITFDGASADPGFGLAKLPGWYDAAPVREEGRRRPISDGNFGVDRFYRDARVITVRGRWVGESIEEAYEKRAELEAMQLDGKPSQLSVTDHFGTRTVMARLANAPQMSDELYAPWFDYAFEVIADDPNKYGPESVLTTGLPTSGTGLVYPITYPLNYGTGGDPGRVTLTNTGRAPTTPTFEVLGGLSLGVELVEITTGSFLRLERPISVSSTVFFHPRTGRVYLDDPTNDISSFLTRREWAGFTIPAGESRTVQFNGLGVASGSPLLTARFSPAY